ncbi:hypothetical protein TSUD_294290 [Trifolium subterraneum]|uniref:Uncharacterized protein n=1 Tax=Trifolium subterraneum TaxID=3900 RepID=A0A2Z6M8M2_TRISU|nr:hypothetical protein TSUD_294290 [Trifolium subterraneum]
MSLSDDESLVRADDVVATKEPNTNKGNQDMDISAETVSLKENEGSIEGDDMTIVDSYGNID